MRVDVIAWTGTTEPAGGRTARAVVDGVRVSVRRLRDGTVSWRCNQHGQGYDERLCPHTAALAEAEADPTKRRSTP